MQCKFYFIILTVFTNLILYPKISFSDDLIDNIFFNRLARDQIIQYAQNPELRKFYGIPRKKAAAKLYYWKTKESQQYQSLALVYFNAKEKITDSTQYYNDIIESVDKAINAYKITYDYTKKNYASVFKDTLKKANEENVKRFIDKLPINPAYKQKITDELSDLTNTLIFDVAGAKSIQEMRNALARLLIKQLFKNGASWGGWFASLKAHQQYESSLLAKAVLDEYFYCGADFVVMQKKNNISDKPIFIINLDKNDWIIQQYAYKVAKREGYHFENLIDEDYNRVHKSINFINGYADDFFTYYENHINEFIPKRSSMRPIVSLLLNGKPHTNLQEGLVAHYEFEGNADDSSGNNHNGTTYGGLAYTSGHSGVPNNPGQAAMFDGIDDYISIQTVEQLRTSSYSVSFWLKTDTTRYRISLFSGLYSNGSNDNNGYQINLGHNPDNYLDYNGKIVSEHMTAQNGNWGASSTIIVNDNSWHHVAVTYDQSIAKVYIDGQLNNSFDPAGTQYQSGPVRWEPSYHDFYIGRNGDNSRTDYVLYDGLIDNLYIYSRALSQNEVLELFNSDE